MNASVYFFALFFGFLRAFACLSTISPLRSFLRPTGLMALSIALGLASLPHEVAAIGTVPANASAWLPLRGVSQLVYGFLLALPVAIALESLAMGGRMFDAVRGAMFAEQVAPSLEGRVSLLESAAPLATLMVIFEWGEYQRLVPALVSPEISLQLAQLPSQAFWQNFIAVMLRGSAQAILFGVMIAAPLLMASLAIDGFLFVAGRCLGRLNLGTEIMPFRLVFGLWLLGVLSTSLPERLMPPVRAAELSGKQLAASLFKP